LLCFLHGYAEAAPMDIREALTLHGPLNPANPQRVTETFIVIAPQLPFPGDRWFRYADEVMAIAEAVREREGGDATRTYLSGFSFGGNGVFDLALLQPDSWAALWAVDPTRVPKSDLHAPVWLSLGEVSRQSRDDFIGALHLEPAGKDLGGDRLYLDEGYNHVGSAASAYRDERIYSWLLSKALPFQ
jgi:pimeloyl-ACP methyl ester carboxylesterase